MIQSYQRIYDMILGADPIIKSAHGIDEEQIQPASLDCRLGDKAYRIASSVLPRQGESVGDIIKKRTLYEVDLTRGAIFEKGATYIVLLREKLKLPQNFYAISSTKSSVGRIDVFTRLLADGCPYFDRTRESYKGPLYLEVASLSFIIKVKSGLSLNQIRFRVGNHDDILNNEELSLQYSKYNILYGQNGKPVPLDNVTIKDNGLFFTVDLSHKKIIAFKARENPETMIDLSKKSYYLIRDFWEPIKKSSNGELVLIPDVFYLLGSKERVRIPCEFCSEIVAYDVSSGEYRTHYAGFFDNGFGYGENGEALGTAAVFEVRAHSVPMRLVDGQNLGKMDFERTTEIPRKTYGAKSGSHYIGPNPRLSKYFKDFDKWV